MNGDASTLGEETAGSMAAADASRIIVEVVYALPDRCWRADLKLAPGSTLGDAIAASGVLEAFPELVVEHCQAGVFGRLRGLGEVLAAGDRVEIYRPLTMDAKERRRLRVLAARRRKT